MPRRVSMPKADDLFRPTVVADVPSQPETDGSSAAPEATPTGRTSGRVKHDEKITVYVSADELLAIEQARLTLRRDGLAVDRGRLVREAVGLILEDLEAKGADSLLVARLTEA